ncbi:FKBP-type peptidyl-prolyl cis-trans isomerase [Thiomicrorhabdus heinhorstiae]|uniref:Peptidyl-prolyl cis-trans isomerase n=1 Tax=Thiomicrorhabdus heinhorstiae TaxID=2748010 RepID=A0ABS0BX11_9GAMM|nr:FKBP-type peptidyl-prolyl cis-trans isomerase [Thiomicrorhabdus heinhorstiae]MBF6058346.1 FKBP-type peptidyl-prolyl cis-trans isomerase [Thiomicrorhabdus heinhorstiae]
MRLASTSLLAIALATSSTLSVASEKPAGKAELTTLEQKASYTLGTNLAQNLKKQGLNIDVKAFSMGLDDALNDRPLSLSEQEMMQAVTETKKMMLEKQAAEKEAQIKNNQAESKAFIEKYAKEDGVKKTDNGLLYKILQSGDAKGSSPSDSDTIFAHYEGRFIDGKVFDSSYQRGTALKLKTANVIKGWGEVLKMMKPGDKWEVVIPPEMAYGARGAGDVIGPDKTLIFTIELVSFNKDES